MKVKLVSLTKEHAPLYRFTGDVEIDGELRSGAPLSVVGDKALRQLRQGKALPVTVKGDNVYITADLADPGDTNDSASRSAVWTDAAKLALDLARLNETKLSSDELLALTRKLFNAAMGEGA